MLSKFVVDTLIRHKKAQLGSLPFDRYSIRLARTVEEYEDAFRLVQVAYAYQGIEDLGRKHLRMTDQHVLPEAYVIVAYEGDRLVGTMTVTDDSPAKLPLDKDYPEQLRALRREKGRLVEIGSFAVVRRCWSTGVAQLLAMASVRLSCVALRASQVVIGIHPKAAPFYRAVWGFRHMGKEKGHADLHAPVCLMVVDPGDCRRHVERHFSKACPSGRKVSDHLFGDSPIPNSDLREEAIRAGEARMPREVFQKLFIERTDHLESLEEDTRSYLKTRRSDETLGVFETEAGALRAISVA